MLRLLRWILWGRPRGHVASPRADWAFRVDRESISWQCHRCGHGISSPLGTTTVVRCPSCGAKRAVFGRQLQPRRRLLIFKEKYVFVTNATMEELAAKEQGREYVTGRAGGVRAIRSRLVYHSRYECAFAHKDYEVDGILVAYNSGVVKALWHNALNMYESCAGVEFRPCDRCGGRGDIPRFRHVQGGTCFKCRGAGYLRVYPEQTEGVRSDKSARIT